MKLTKIEFYVATQTFTFPIFGSSPFDKYILKKVEGLDPPDSNLFIQSVSGNRAIYQGRRPENRQLVVTFELNPDYSLGETVSDLRQELYKTLTMTNSDDFPLEIRFFYYPDDNPSNYVYTTGHAKKIVASPFSQSNEVQLTIDCLSPYLSGHEVTLDLGTLQTTPGYLLFDKIGTAPSEFQCVIKRINALSGLRCTLNDVRGQGSNHKAKLDMQPYLPSQLILQNDLITIVSYNGQRTISLKRGTSDAVNFLYTLTSASNWFSLMSNPIELQIEPFGEYEFMSFSYWPQYWGI